MGFDGIDCNFILFSFIFFSIRAKRQFNPQNYYPNPAFGSPVGFNPYGQSQATANAHSHTIDPFGNSNADAGAQGTFQLSLAYSCYLR